MTRKISKEEKRLRKMKWAMGQISESMLKMSVSTKEATEAFTRLGIALDGKEPAYNWPETPERSRMHAMYAHKKGRA